MRIKLMIGLTDSGYSPGVLGRSGAETTAQKHGGSRATTDPISSGFGDDRATLVLADTAALHLAAKHGSIDVDPNA